MIEEPSWNDDFVELRCDSCGNPVVMGKELHCCCDKYGYVGHEEDVYCSDDCLEKAHSK